MTNTSMLRADDVPLAKEFRDYVYAVSHDVGAPVRAMVEFSRLLTDEHKNALNDEGRLYLSFVIENGQKLQRMMDGLLDYSRLNTEAQSFAKTDCDLALKNAVIALSDIIQNKHAVIETELLPDVIGDKTQIWQMFVILLDNALKFCAAGEKPHISIRADKENNWWKFTVADNGVGIAPRFHQKIFGLFQKLHPDTAYPGIGMGLTLAQRIAHRHGGEIWVEGDEGQGSVFCFTIPTGATPVV